MDVPISLGVLLALTMSVVETARHAEHAYFDSAIMLLVFLLAGRYLDQAMRRKTRSYAANLSALRAPVAARIEAGGEISTVPAAALKAGDTVLVRPGERIPVDGLVIDGRSEIDQSLVTGETAPCAASVGCEVFAGTLNFSGALRIRVARRRGRHAARRNRKADGWRADAKDALPAPRRPGGAALCAGRPFHGDPDGDLLAARRPIGA